MMRRHRLARAAALSTMLLMGGGAHAQVDPLLQQFSRDELSESGPSQGYVAPHGRFRFRAPSALELDESSDPDTLIFRGNANGNPVVMIFKRVGVTAGAQSSQLRLTTRDRFRDKLPNFTVIRQGTAKIAGRPCATMLGRYDYQGNKGYPQIVENAFIVDGAEGFIIHTEVAEPGYPYIARDIADVYKTFKTIPHPSQALVKPPPPFSADQATPGGAKPKEKTSH